MSDVITITGNIGTPPENKRTSAGVSITTFRVGSGQRRYDRATGAWIDTETNWYTVSAYRGLADHAFESLRKGDRVILTGRLRVRSWDNGTKRGTDVDIDIDAIGHDLRFGTTRYEKAAQPRQEEEAPAGADGDEWAASESATGDTPAESAPAPGWGAPSDESRELALAGSDTPF